MERRADLGGRPARVSRPIIAEAALELGLSSLTLSSLAQRLGVDHSSLYRHVESRNDIIVLACDTAVARMDWPEVPDLPDDVLASAADTSWRRYLEQACESVWDMYDRHPGLASAIHHLDTAPEQVLLRFARAIRDLVRMGFAEADAVIALDTVLDISVESYVGWERVSAPAEDPAARPASSARVDTTAPAAPDRRGMLAIASTRMLAEAARRTALGATDRVTTWYADAVRTGSAATPRAWWRRKLGLLLDGIAELRSSG